MTTIDQGLTLATDCATVQPDMNEPAHSFLLSCRVAVVTDAWDIYRHERVR